MAAPLQITAKARFPYPFIAKILLGGMFFGGGIAALGDQQKTLAKVISFLVPCRCNQSYLDTRIETYNHTPQTTTTTANTNTYTYSNTYSNTHRQSDMEESSLAKGSRVALTFSSARRETASDLGFPTTLMPGSVKDLLTTCLTLPGRTA